MEKSYTKRYLHISHRRIITYICYTMSIIGWHGFNCISLLGGVMSMELPNENNASSTAAEVLNLSLASMKSSGSHPESVSSVPPLPSLAQKRSMEFATTNPMGDNAPIHGWECFCWNITTTGYEVKSLKISIKCQRDRVKRHVCRRATERKKLNMNRFIEQISNFSYLELPPLFLSKMTRNI